MSTTSLIRALTRALPYGCRAVFLGSHLVAVGFVAELFMPRTSDPSLHAARTTNLFIDVMLLLALALQYVVTKSPPDMARWIGAAGTLPAANGVTLLATSRALLAAMFFWRPLDGIVWSVGEPLASAVIGLCLFGVLTATAGLLRGRPARPQCYAGCIAAMWSTPTMTTAHALVAAAATIAFVVWFITTPRPDRESDGETNFRDVRTGPVESCPR